MITVKVVGLDGTIRALGDRRQKIITNLTRTVESGVNAIKLRTKMNYLRGPRPQHLGVKTGNLYNSIRSWVEVLPDGAAIIGKVGTNVWYGKAWELGFTVPAHTIVPRKKKYLHFFIGDKEIFCKEAHIPAMTKKPRPFLTPALMDYKARITEELKKALQ